ncbi:MAG: hypothetical protein PHD82_02720 [Candidatus Riflebacteria bacterium]|nr:hypothetical protein [Candidatus Riflebacteria bacterium]
MWNYNRQILIRYLSFIVALAAIAAFFNFAGDTQPDLSSKTGIKNFLTSLAISAEFLPMWAYPAFFLGAFIFMAAGVPSIIIFAILLVLKGFVWAFLLTWASQILVSFFALAWSRRKFDHSRQHPVYNQLRGLSDDSWSFAFWSRVYYAFPLRTIDSYTPALQSDGNIFTAVASAVAIRMLLPSLWLDSVITLATSLGNDPAQDLTMMLLWSSAIVVYTLIPRVHELFICPAKIKKALYSIEEPAKTATAATTGQGSENGLKGPQVKIPPPKATSSGVGTKPQLLK